VGPHHSLRTIGFEQVLMVRVSRLGEDGRATEIATKKVTMKALTCIAIIGNAWCWTIFLKVN
jgi:hypothetical protein